MERNPVIVEFVSASTAGIVNIQLGFVPDFAELIADHGGTPVVYKWVNNRKFANFPATRTVVQAGGSTAFSANSGSLITPYDGGERLAATQTADSAPKHINEMGVAASSGDMTKAGVSIAAAAQVNSGRNVLVAYRGNF